MREVLSTSRIQAETEPLLQSAYKKLLVHACLHLGLGLHGSTPFMVAFGRWGSRHDNARTRPDPRTGHLVEELWFWVFGMQGPAGECHLKVYSLGRCGLHRWRVHGRAFRRMRTASLNENHRVARHENVTFLSQTRNGRVTRPCLRGETGNASIPEKNGETGCCCRPRGRVGLGTALALSNPGPIAGSTGSFRRSVGRRSRT